jgi:hypothetical protein
MVIDCSERSSLNWPGGYGTEIYRTLWQGDVVPQALPKDRARKRPPKIAKTYRFDARLNIRS